MIDEETKGPTPRETPNQPSEPEQIEWLDRLVSSSATVANNLERIKDFAYNSFDKLDRNKSGFVEFKEMYAALADNVYTREEKSFITFLLANEPAIADACDEGLYVRDGISKQDIELYFRIIIDLL